MKTGPNVLRLRSGQDDFRERFESLLAVTAENDPQVEAAVREIVAAVRRDGESAVLEYTRRFDAVVADTLSSSGSGFRRAVSTPRGTRSGMASARH